MTDTLTAPRGYTLDIPDGFITIPPGDLTESNLEQVAAEVAAAFHLDEVTDNARQLAYGLSASFSAVTEFAGHLAVGLFRSPAADRPIMVILTCLARVSEHATVAEAIAGVHRIHQEAELGEVEVIELTAGPAVTVVTETLNELTIDGEPTGVPVLARTVTAWLPDPDGTTVAAVSLASNNWQDWEPVCELALTLFNSLEWQ